MESPLIKELRRVVRRQVLRERTEGVIEHDQRFSTLMDTLVELMNEYQMDPKAIAQLAARRIYEKVPKPPWVNDADAHTLHEPGGSSEKKGSGEGGEKKKPTPAQQPPQKKKKEEEVDEVERLEFGARR